MSAQILVEGESDEAILKAILPETQKGVRYWRSRGSGSMLSLARSLLASGRGPVAVVLDADTTDDAAVEEREKNARKLLELAGDEGDWALVVFVPEIEEILLQDADVLKALRSSADAVSKLRRGGHEKSREVFRKILSRNRQGMEEWLKATDLTHLRGHPPVNGLVSFLRAHGVRIAGAKRGSSS